MKQDIRADQKLPIEGKTEKGAQYEKGGFKAPPRAKRGKENFLKYSQKRGFGETSHIWPIGNRTFAGKISDLQNGSCTAERRESWNRNWEKESRYGAGLVKDFFSESIELTRGEDIPRGTPLARRNNMMGTG